MQSDPMALFGEAQSRVPHRWERLRDVFEKLRMVLDRPALCPGGVDDLLQQLEQRLAEASNLFPDPDWFGVDTATSDGLERYCGNHLGAALDILGRVVEALAEERARELAGPCPRDGGV